MRFDGMDAWLAFGTLGRPHGVKGEICLHAFNPNARVPERLRLPSEVCLKGEDPPEFIIIRSFRGNRGHFRLQFQSVETREAAAALTNRILLIPKDCFPVLSPDEFYVAEILGWMVESDVGGALGRVDSLSWNGAHDVIRVVSPSGEEHLLPVVPEFILRLDRARKVVVVDLHE